MKNVQTNNALVLKICLVIGILASIATSAFGGGTIYFDGMDIINGKTKAPAANFKVTLYYGMSPGSLQAGPTVTDDSFGNYWGNNGDPITLPFPYSPGMGLYVQVKAWLPSTYSTYDDAVASGNPMVLTYASSIGYYQLGSDADNAPWPTEFSDFTLKSVVSSSGSLQVTISPAGAVSAGAQWRVDNGSWQNSGATVSGLSAGAHSVNFKTVSGWMVPETQNMSVYVYANQTTTVTGVYPESGLQVFSSPSAAGGALWHVAGENWLPTGVAIGISAGLHTVSFSPISGWITPADQTATCFAGAMTAVTGVYKPYASITPDAIHGVGPNGFGMSFTGTPGQIFVVDASTNMVNWVPLQTNTLTSGPIHFYDPQWTNYPGRFYRLRSQ